MRIAVSFDHHGMSGACENAICRRNAPALHDQRSDRLRLVQQRVDNNGPVGAPCLT